VNVHAYRLWAFAPPSSPAIVGIVVLMIVVSIAETSMAMTMPDSTETLRQSIIRISLRLVT
jgi:hypothetical protein